MEIWVRKFDEVCYGLSSHQKVRRAFTLIELLVVVAIISLLLSIAVPAFNVVRQKASVIASIVNQRGIATSLNLYANDSRDRYPDSIATVGKPNNTNTATWNWADPRLMIGYKDSFEPRKPPSGHRSMSSYLSSYVDDPETLHCKNAPEKYKYTQESWDAGDYWNNPDRLEDEEHMAGSYCFWWNYKGWLTDQGKVFNGPTRSSGGNGQSSILVSDYFGSDTWRNWGEYGTCENFAGANITASNSLFSSFYTGGDISEPPPAFKLNAVYTDGHVESYSSLDVVTLEVSQNRDGTRPFGQLIGKGKFYLPKSSMP